MKKLSLTLRIKSVRSFAVLALAGAACLPTFAGSGAPAAQAVLTQVVSRDGLVQSRSVDARGMLTSSQCLVVELNGIVEQRCVSETQRLSSSQAEYVRAEMRAVARQEASIAMELSSRSAGASASKSMSDSAVSIAVGSSQAAVSRGALEAMGYATGRASTSKSMSSDGFVSKN